jgi:hypothetical protein
VACGAAGLNLLLSKVKDVATPTGIKKSY